MHNRLFTGHTTLDLIDNRAKWFKGRGKVAEPKHRRKVRQLIVII